MSDDGTTKDDVKIPDGECGDKIKKLFQDEGKDTSELHLTSYTNSDTDVYQTSSFSPPWARRSPLIAKRLPSKRRALRTEPSGTGLSDTFTWLLPLLAESI